VRIVFWRNDPLSGEEERLLAAIEGAHRKSAMRVCGSSQAVQIAAGGSGSYESSVAAGILTLGGKHAPIREIYQTLEQPRSVIETRINAGERVPGWGNSFFRGSPDPDWHAVRFAFLVFPQMLDHIDFVTSVFHARQKMLYPNAGCYTAAAAKIVGLPAETASYLLISARLPVWTELAQRSL
jgi:citrate synthase